MSFRFLDFCPTNARVSFGGLVVGGTDPQAPVIFTHIFKYGGKVLLNSQLAVNREKLLFNNSHDHVHFIKPIHLQISVWKVLLSFFFFGETFFKWFYLLFLYWTSLLKPWYLFRLYFNYLSKVLFIHNFFVFWKFLLFLPSVLPA